MIMPDVVVVVVVAVGSLSSLVDCLLFVVSTSFCCCRPSASSSSSFSPVPSARNVPVFLAFFLSLCLFMAVVLFLRFHLRLLRMNMTTVEYLEKYNSSKRTTKHRFAVAYIKHNFGARGNVRHIMGDSWWHWLLPIAVDRDADDDGTYSSAYDERRLALLLGTLPLRPHELGSHPPSLHQVLGEDAVWQRMSSAERNVLFHRIFELASDDDGGGGGGDFGGDGDGSNPFYRKLHELASMLNEAPVFDVEGDTEATSSTTTSTTTSTTSTLRRRRPRRVH
eukprot:TRINITY_DN66824_c10_g2_i3.p1 TRINITY_DN66824_c10_g2~~TRINITY_DN66824_c10_g2_i3.p1  ORF type:complete len:279 (-),score=129.69 TRINITY_DN66824_c10_g2_i3:74-910(-)